MAITAENVDFKIRLIDEASETAKIVRVNFDELAGKVGGAFTKIGKDVVGSATLTVKSVEEMNKVLSGLDPRVQKLGDVFEESTDLIGRGVSLVDSETDEFSASLRKADKETKELKTSSDKTTSSFGKWSVAMSRLLIQFGIFQSVRFIVRDILDLATAIGRAAENSAKMLDAGEAFNRLASRVTDANKAMRDIDRASGNVIDKMTLVQQATSAAVTGLPIERYHELVGVTRGLASVMGRDMIESLRRMTQGIAKQEVELLDEFGLVVRLNDALDDFAQKNNTTVQALSASERQMAFFNAVLDAGQRKIRDMGGIIDENQRPFLEFRRALADVGTEFGGFLNRMLGVDRIVGGLANSFSDFADSISSDTDKIAAKFSEIGRQTDALEDVQKAARLVRDEIASLQQQYNTLSGAGEDTTVVQRELIDRFTQLNELVPSLGINVKDLTQNLDPLISRLKELATIRQFRVRTEFLETFEAESEAALQAAENIDTLNNLRDKLRTSGLEEGIPVQVLSREESEKIDRAIRATTGTFVTFSDAEADALEMAEKIVDILQLTETEARVYGETLKDLTRQYGVLNRDTGIFQIHGDNIGKVWQGLDLVMARNQKTLSGFVFEFREFLRTQNDLDSFEKAVRDFGLSAGRHLNLNFDTGFLNEMIKQQIRLFEELDARVKPENKLLDADELEKEARKAISAWDVHIERFETRLLRMGATNTEIQVKSAELTRDLIAIEHGFRGDHNQQSLRETKAFQKLELDLEKDLLLGKAKIREDSAEEQKRTLFQNIEREMVLVEARFDQESEQMALANRNFQAFSKGRVDFDKLTRADQLRLARNLSQLEVANLQASILEQNKARVNGLQDAADEQIRYGKRIATVNERKVSETAQIEAKITQQINRQIASRTRIARANERELEKQRKAQADKEIKASAAFARNALQNAKIFVEADVEARITGQMQILGNAIVSGKLMESDRVRLIERLKSLSAEQVRHEIKMGEERERIIERIEKRVSDMLEKFSELGIATSREVLNAQIQLGNLSEQAKELKLDAVDPLSLSITDLTNRLDELSKKAKSVELDRFIEDIAKESDQLLQNLDDFTATTPFRQLQNDFRSIDRDTGSLNDRLVELTAERVRIQSTLNGKITDDQRVALNEQLKHIEEAEDRALGILSASNSVKLDLVREFALNMQSELMNAAQNIAVVLGGEAQEFVAFVSKLTEDLIQLGFSATSGNVVGVITSFTGVVSNILTFMRNRAEREFARLKQIAGSTAQEIGRAFSEGMDIDFNELVQNFVRANVAEQIADAMVGALGEEFDAIGENIGNVIQPDEKVIRERANDLLDEEADRFARHGLEFPEELRKKRFREFFEQEEENARLAALGGLEAAALEGQRKFEDAEPRIGEAIEAIEKVFGSFTDESNKLADQIPTASFRAVTEPQANQMLAIMGSGLDLQRQIASNTSRMVELLGGQRVNNQQVLQAPGHNRDVNINERLDIFVNGNNMGQANRLEDMPVQQLVGIINRIQNRMVQAKEAGLGIQ